MKKSTKYLIFLTASFVVITLVIPVVFGIKINRTEVSVNEADEPLSRQEVPFVDQEINSITMGYKIADCKHLRVIGVDSPKNQCVVVTVKSYTDRTYPIDISLENNDLEIDNSNYDMQKVDSLTIYIANSPDKPLKFCFSYIPYYSNDCSVSFENLCFSDLNMDYWFEKCTFTNCKLPVVDIDQMKSVSDITFKDSETDMLKIVSAYDIKLYDDNSISNLSVTAQGDLNLLLSGYEGELDLQKNRHHIYLDRE